MTETVQAATFSLRVTLLPDGRMASQAEGNLNPALILAALEITKKKILEQMENPSIPITGSRAPVFNIRRMP